MTLDQIFATEFFITTFYERVNKELKDLPRKQRRFSVTVKGSPVNTLNEMGILHPKQLSDEYLLIYEKRSKLSSREREWIKPFIGDLILATLAHYNEIEKAKKTEVVEEPLIIQKVRKPRKKKSDENN